MSSRTPDHISDVEWCYTIRAAAGQRLLMRVVLIFDQQALTPSRLDWRCADGIVHLDLFVRCEPALAGRVHAKLHALHDMRSVLLRQMSGTALRDAAQGNAHAARKREDDSDEVMPRDTI